MTSRPEGTSPRPLRKRRGPLLPTIVIAIVLVVGFVFFAQVWSDVLWYQQLGFIQVFVTQNLARGAVFLVGALGMGLAIYASIKLAYRARPVYAPNGGPPDALSRYQAQLEPIRRIVMAGVPIVFGLFAGAAAASQWQKAALFFSQVPFGQTDPQFGLDLSFYLFTLPFLGTLVGYLLGVVVISGIAGLLTHYLYGSIRISERGIYTARVAQLHLAVSGALLVLLIAVNFWLDRYGTLQNSYTRWAGAMYTDVNAVIPTKAILAIAAGIVAILFIVAAVIGRWRLPLIGTAMLVITGIFAGGVYPWVIQQFQVTPSEKTLEAPYIDRTIKLTREAYGLDSVEVSAYNATTTAAPGALQPDAQTTQNIRLLDPTLISSTFQQLEQYRPYYQFSPMLNVDRYSVNNANQDTVIAVRELNLSGLSPNQQSWYNTHIVYTHGYGVVAAYGNKATADGKPQFLQSGIPTTGVLGSEDTYQPRIYFGQYSPDYSVVGASSGAQPREQDKPQGSQGDTLYTYTGNGGPNVGNLFNRLIYALKFQSTDLLFSDGVNDKSQILYNREPRDRVQKVAPYLTLDGTVYPAIVDGKVKWIVDGYTTSQYFPYSQQQQLQQVTTDSQTGAGRNTALPPSSVNYIRNSVKATVDAFDGSVTLYAWDDQDPVLKTWEKVFPSTVKPLSEMSGSLMSHVRYPEDLFKVQRELLARYHVTDPASFYQNDDVWSVPNDPAPDKSSSKQPPYYMSLQMPDQKTPAFQLTSSYIPQTVEPGKSREVMYGFLAADSDAGSKTGVKGPEYGKLRLLRLPTDTTVPGPGQVQSRFDSDPSVSTSLNLLRQGASKVQNGNLLTLPVGGGLLYVEPVYVQSTGSTSYPTLQRVLVAFGDKVGFAPTLDDALKSLFGGNSGASAGDAGTNPQNPPQQTPPPAASGATDQLNQALKDAQQALKDSQSALTSGDFAAYGAAQKRLSDAVTRALDAEAKIAAAQQGQGGASSGSSTPSPSSSATPSPSPSK
ncbi:UPF0182 family protein [Sinomonas sp. ASV322]|uniref:UPF0182 family membrane protein n=1 Tax=Sinomonas sp. ASV322 TaxID=3041920 RepID=UPI0027DD699E|nr:UPF0182 family protein [Sinomonas sp. ASV322]MDQ4503295.1 UPF0182 family protein [Sinomonas sp. ASV322]